MGWSLTINQAKFGLRSVFRAMGGQSLSLFCELNRYIVEPEFEPV